jgi:protein-S-isoprenylcysteine O-methyltransferase Ste14
MKAVNRIVAVLLALVCAFAVAVAVTALNTDGTIIVWRFALVVIVAIAAAYGAVKMWRRPARDVTPSP